jgi:predicted phosphodiesterase
MRALILSDIHGNLEALTAVLDAAGAWDVLWNLGDMVGYGASPNEVLERVRPISTMTVRGNHDRVCCGISSAVHFNPTARAAAKWTLETLTAENVAWLRDLPQGPLYPKGQEWEKPGLAIAHGSPLNEDHYILNMRDAWAPLQQMMAAITFFGHTHVQGGFLQKEHDWHELRPRHRPGNEAVRWTLEIPEGTRLLVNPGSVGQPRDHDWRAAFSVYDAEKAEITYHRVPYDLAKTQGKILRAGLPERLAARLREGR